MNAYASLTTWKSRLSISGTTDDTQQRLLLEAVSRMVDKYCLRFFYAKTAANYFNGAISPMTVNDLLSITTFKLDQDGDNTYEDTLAATDYYLWPYNDFPKQMIYVAPNGDYGSFANGVRKGVEIAGLWGYGTGLTATPYTTSGTTSAEELDASETGVDVADGTALETGQTILIESEQMYIQSISSNTLTVRRAVNGTTAATHATGKTVYIYEYPETISEAVIITTSRLWKRRESAYATVIALPGESTMEVHRGLDSDVKLMLNPFINISGGMA